MLKTKSFSYVLYIWFWFFRDIRTWKNLRCVIDTAKQGWEFAVWFFVRIAHFSWAKENKANRSRRSLQKSDGGKSDGSNSLLGIKMGLTIFAYVREIEAIFKTDFARQSSTQMG